jgi:hypothetical protein
MKFFLTVAVLACYAGTAAVWAQITPILARNSDTQMLVFDMAVGADASIWAVGSFQPAGDVVVHIRNGQIETYSREQFPESMRSKATTRIVLSPNDNTVAYVINQGGIAELRAGEIRNATPVLDDTLNGRRRFIDMAIDAQGNKWYVASVQLPESFDGVEFQSKEVELIRHNSTFRVWSGNTVSTYPQRNDSLFGAIPIAISIRAFGNDIYLYGFPNDRENPFGKSSVKIDLSEQASFGGLVCLRGGENLEIFSYGSGQLYSSNRLSIREPSRLNEVSGVMYLGFNNDPGKGIAPMVRLQNSTLTLVNPRSLTGFVPEKFGAFSSTTYAPWLDDQSAFVVGGGIGLYKVTGATIERLPDPPPLSGSMLFNPAVTSAIATDSGLIVAYYAEGIYHVPWSTLSVQEANHKNSQYGTIIGGWLTIEEGEQTSVFSCTGQLLFSSSAAGTHGLSFIPNGPVMVCRTINGKTSNHYVMLAR